MTTILENQFIERVERSTVEIKISIMITKKRILHLRKAIEELKLILSKKEKLLEEQEHVGQYIMNF